MNKWISVENELPTADFDWVLVFSDGAIGMKGYTTAKGFFDPYPTVSNLRGYTEITHWMPAPEAPEEVRGD
jgi:hypothetical protein